MLDNRIIPYKSASYNDADREAPPFKAGRVHLYGSSLICVRSFCTDAARKIRFFRLVSGFSATGEIQLSVLPPLNPETRNLTPETFSRYPAKTHLYPI